MSRRIIAVLFSAFIFALAGFLLAILTGPVWEARATLSVDTPEALAALPGMLAGEGASAYAIPGTDVLEIALRAVSPALAQGELDRALSRIPAFLNYLEISADFCTLTTAARCISQPQPGHYALGGGILGALAAILWMIPAPKTREPLDLGQFLTALARAALRRAVPMFLTIFLLAGGNALRISFTTTPQYAAEALIRVGDYNPATADGLAGAVLGLGNSQLGDPNVAIKRVGNTNLFRLSAVSDSERVAKSHLNSFLDTFPKLLSHITGNPDVLVLEEPQVHGPEISSPLRAAALGAAVGITLWLLILTGEILRSRQGLFPRG